VAGKAVLTHEVAQSATEGEPGDAGSRCDAEGGRQAEGRRLPIELTEQDTPLRTNRARSWVDSDALHGSDIDRQGRVTDPCATDAVTSTANRNRHIEAAGELDGVDHVGDAYAAGDHRRPLFNHSVPDLAGRVITRIQWRHELATEGRSELTDRAFVQS